MKGITRLAIAAAVACCLVSCTTAGNLLNGIFGAGGRALDAIGRTAGLSADAGNPDQDPNVSNLAAVQARGTVIQHQGQYGDAAPEQRPEKIAGR